MKTEKTQKRSMKNMVLIGVLLLFAVVAIAVVRALPKTQTVSDSAYDLNALADGLYRGECDNGLVVVAVEVEVQDHRVMDIRILKHQNGKGQPAEVIVEQVIARQSLEVESIGGATASSQTILKAIENALAS